MNKLFFIKLLLTSLMTMFLSLIFLINKKMIIIEWLFYSIMSLNLKFILMIDWMSLMFMSIVMLISSMVMLYNKEYMMMDLKKNYFNMILLMFVISMMFMIISPNIFSIIIGWDGLGLISYCLIIYYQNNYSFNSGMLTLLTNRIGDIMLLMIMFMLMNLNSWNLFIYPSLYNKLMSSMLFIMMMTKSAQIPFSMWLPAAMAAPTPVSSLVHSSTLVTAGIYLLIRFNKILINNKMNLIIMIFSLLTMLIASINALFSFDIKKIIAFSTLSQLGLMMLMLSYKLTDYTFLHLISHAMFKSLLFLCSGVMIHFMNNTQDIRYLGNLIHESPLIILYFNFSNMSLSGMPFLSGFFSKDTLYEMIILNKINMMIFYFMYLCIMLTLMYTIRLMMYSMFNMNTFITINKKNDSMIMNLSIMMLFILSITLGTLMNWILFSSMNYSMINIKLKFIIYCLMILSLTNLFINFKIKINSFMLNLFKILTNFFYLNKLSMIYNYTYLKNCYKQMNINELKWNEFYNYKFITFILNNIFILLNNNFKNKMNKILIMSMYSIMIFMLFM
uniref:NADH-ubiquinone oxidoreductase chain 5 n=1 Tax=Aegilips sp. ZJUH 20220002 TaxID=2943451 RepID=A0A9E8G755_9HYME|nr:NADH dehydrogenase subunit 5 [Aegilips sp. ZJUH 20220002]